MRLFDEACELGEEECAALLERVARETPDLGRSLAAMVREDRRGGSGFDALDAAAVFGALGAEEVAPDPTTSPGTMIGRYRLRSRIGEGGMGVVHLAEQEEPRRLVALKLIRPGLARGDTLRRFRREAGLLGRLQHPGIAQVFEAGVAELDGAPIPFIAMEYVDGPQITDYARRHRLSELDRLELVARVADAVQHAHLRGVIHRDLKPANILVVDDGTRGASRSGSDVGPGQPKVLDFGVARALDGEAQGATGRTDVGQIIGTLATMSPEQVSGDPAAIDARTDVYALGVILYELLAGRPPLALSGRSMPDAIRAIERDPIERLGTIDRRYRGEIETIVGKALERDKERRYQSAADLAADIRRHRNHEAIIAKPPTAVYRLRKFALRHKAIAAGCALAFATLVVSLVVVNALRLAETRQRRLAERQARVAESVVDFLNLELVAGASPFLGAEPDVTLRDVLRRAADRIDGTFEDPAAEAAVRYATGMIFRGLGEYPSALEHLTRSMDLRREHLGDGARETLATMSALGELLTWLGRTEEARGILEEADRIAVRARPQDDALRLDLAGNLAALDRAESSFRASADRLEAALERHGERLGQRHLETLTARNALAEAYDALGLAARAEAIYRENLELLLSMRGERHPDVLLTSNNLGAILLQTGRLDEAEPLLLRVMTGYAETLGEDHPETVTALGNVAVLRLYQGRLDEAAECFTRSLERIERRTGPLSLEAITAHNNLANLALRRGDVVESQRRYRDALERAVAALGTDHFQTMVARLGLAQAHLAAGRSEEALPLALESHAWFTAHLEPDAPMRVRAERTLAEARAPQERSTATSTPPMHREESPDPRPR